MKLGQNITIDFDRDIRVYEVVIQYNTREEEDALQNEFDTDFDTEIYEEGEMTLAINRDEVEMTKAELMKEIKRRIKSIK